MASATDLAREMNAPSHRWARIELHGRFKFWDRIRILFGLPVNAHMPRADIFIGDDHFITDKRWVAAFCHALKREQLQFNFFYQTRVDNFDETVAAALRDAGTQYISFGIESIHPDVLRFYDKTRSPPTWRELTRTALQERI